MAAAHEDVTAADLADILSHIALPPKLPHEAPLEDEDRRIQANICQVAYDAARAYHQHLPAGPQHQLWSHMIQMLMHLWHTVLVPLETDHLHQTLVAMQVGDVIALHIRAQNAALIMRKGARETKFEVFEVTPPAKTVMSTAGKLLCSYPGPAVTVPASLAHDPAFLQQLVAFAAEMDSTGGDAAPDSAGKRRTDHGSTDPRWVAQLLVGILRGMGTTLEVPRITKRIADEVVGRSGAPPWRRSPIWLIIRVALQTSLPMSDYKSFMVFLHARLLSLCATRGLASDLLFVLRAKTARRLYKIRDSAAPFVAQAVDAASTATENVLQAGWTAVQRAQATSPEWDPVTLNLSADTAITLPGSRAFISDLLHPGPAETTASVFMPAHAPRLRNIRDFAAYADRRLTVAVEADDDRHVALADFEQSVQDNLDDWVMRRLNSASTSPTLVSCMDQYLDLASQHYAGNAEHLSIMVLTMLELWVGMDKVAVAQCPLLSEYPPEIPLNFADPLLLRRSKSLSRAVTIGKYIRERYNSAGNATSIFSDDPTPTSFAVMYFSNSTELQQLRDRIERTAERARNAKRIELERLNAEHARIMAEVAQMVHQMTERDGVRTHSARCLRCQRKEKAESVKIEVHEWPLPEDDLRAAMVVFELSCPAVFVHWRAMTYKILCNIGLPARTKVGAIPPVCLVLENYSGLSQWATFDDNSRITLGSTTNSFANARYRFARIPATEDSVIVGHRLQYRLFDKVAQNWAAGPFEESGVTHLCTLRLPVDSPYHYLQDTVTWTGHTSNQVIAGQADCPTELTLHEHIAFGSLRSGGRIQWLNIARELASNSLNFNKEEVQTLVTQAAWQIGSLSPDGSHREWHAELAQPAFGRILLRESHSSLRSIESNWLQGVTARTIILLVSRLLAATTDAGVQEAACTLLMRARSITFQWVCELSAKLQASIQQSEVSSYQTRVCEMAATCSLSYDVDSHYLLTLMHTPHDVATIVQCAITVYDNLPPALDKSPTHVQMLIARHFRLLHAIEPSLRQSILSDSEGLDEAIVSIWPSYRPGAAGWRSLSEPNARWLTSVTASDAQHAAQNVHFNLLTGCLLINAKQLGRLPLEIVNHPLYARIFDQKVLDIVPADLPGMDFATRTLIGGYQVSFALRDNKTRLVIKAKRGARVLELIPHDVFSGDFPTFFVKDYAHWLDLSSGQIEFRPLERLWQSDTANWSLRFSEDPSRPCVMTHGELYVLLVDVHSPTFRMVARHLKPLESAEYLTITLATLTGRLSTNLSRFRLSFYLNDDLRLESQNMSDMVIDEDQSCGTLFGLRNQLVLRAKDAEARMLPQSRKVLVPLGEVQSILEGDYPRVEITTSPDDRLVTYHVFKIDDDLGYLAGDGSLTSRLYKCYLHALTSYCLPDPLIGRTGTEEALDELQAAGTSSFQRLDAIDVRLLQQIGALTPNRILHYLHHMQQVDWMPLSSLAQHYGFHVAIRAILKHAQDLEVFRESGLTLELARRNQVLQARAARRSHGYYPFDMSTSLQSSFPSSADVPYQARDVPDAVGVEGEYAVFTVSNLVRRNPAELAYASSSVIRTVTNWNSLGIFNDEDVPPQLSLSFSRYWMHPSLPRDWVVLYNTLRHGGYSLETKFQLAFGLGAMAYGSPHYRDLIPAMLAFATNPLFRDIDPPPHSRYNLVDGFAAQQSTLRSVIRSAGRMIHDSPARLLPHREPAERPNSYSARQQMYYDEHISRQSAELANLLILQWPCEALNWPDTDYSAWFNVVQCKAVVLAYFRSCSRNRHLSRHLQLVEDTLHAQPAANITTGEHYTFIPSLTSHDGREPGVSIYTLLSSRQGQLGHLASTFYGAPEINRAYGNPTDTNDLQALLAEFRLNTDSHLLQQYGMDLDLSREELDGQLSSLVPDSMPSQNTLSRVRNECHVQLQALHSTLRQFLSPSTPSERALLMASLWPCLTPRSLLRNLTFAHRDDLLPHWRQNLVSYAQALIEFQRAQRLVGFRMHGQTEELFKELDNALFNHEDALRYPDWLLIQIEGNFFARPIQMRIADEMIAPSSGHNTVLQLNMGEGKSSVIVPMVAAALADGTVLARVVILKALSNQMFQLLVERLGGLVNRRIFFLPFSRSSQTNVARVKVIQALYKKCVHEGGILVAQPEHILLFKLMGLDRVLSSKTAEEQAVADMLQRAQQWLSIVSRDILDESDEILHVRYLLIYAMGQQKALEDSPDRWQFIKDVLQSCRKHAHTLHGQFPSELELEEDTDETRLRETLVYTQSVDVKDYIEYLRETLVYTNK